MNSVNKKSMMVVVAIIWIVYLVIHMLVNINFVFDHDTFNSAYEWFNSVILLRYFIIAVLIGSIFFHVYTAISRQLDSNKKRTISYKKNYPKVIPRFVAWSGAFLLIAFIVFHFIQMQLINHDNLYNEITNMFKDPIMLIIYGLGFVALATHLLHSIGNIRQSFGTNSNQTKVAVSIFVITLVSGFASIPISVHL